MEDWLGGGKEGREVAHGGVRSTLAASLGRAVVVRCVWSCGAVRVRVHVQGHALARARGMAMFQSVNGHTHVLFRATQHELLWYAFETLASIS